MHRSRLLSCLIALALFAWAGVGCAPGEGGSPQVVNASTPPATGSPEWAATRAVQAFYAVDYRDRGRWLSALQPLSSTDGYRLLEYGVAPSIWPALEAAKTVTVAEQVQVEDRGPVAEGQSALGEWQVREVAVSVAPEALWPTMEESSFAAYVLLAREAEGWRFGSFLTEAQVEALKQDGARP